MSTEIRVGRIGAVNMGTVTNPTAAPVNDTDGFDCREWLWCLVRVKASVGVTYSLRVHTFVRDGPGLDWVEDPTERRTPAASADYSRYIFVSAAERIAIEFTAVAGGNIRPVLSFA